MADALGGLYRGRGWQTAAAAVFLVAAAAYAAHVLLPIFQSAGRLGTSDFSWYYVSFRTVLAHADPTAHLYDPAFEHAWMRQHHFAFIPQNFFTLPPTVAVWFSWLGRFSYHTARQLWDLLTLGCLVAALAVAGVWATPRWPHRFILWGTALAVFPVFNNFFWGEINTVVLLLVVLGLWLASRGRAAWAGVLIACAALVMVTPAVIIVAWLAARNWRAVAGAAAATAAAVATVAPFAGAGSFIQYLTRAVPMLGHVVSGHPTAPWNQSLLGVLAVKVHPYDAAFLAFLVLAAACLGTAVYVLRRHSREPRAVAALLALLPLVCAPTVETHHLVQAILPLVLLGGLLWGTTSCTTAAVAPWIAWCAAAVLLILPTAGFPPVVGYSVALLAAPGSSGAIQWAVRALEATQHTAALVLLFGVAAYLAIHSGNRRQAASALVPASAEPDLDAASAQ